MTARDCERKSAFGKDGIPYMRHPRRMEAKVEEQDEGDERASNSTRQVVSAVLSDPFCESRVGFLAGEPLQRR